MIKIENPYSQQRHELIRQFELKGMSQEDFDKQLISIVEKEKEFISEKMQDFQIKVSDYKQKMEEVPVKNKHKICKELVELHRDSKALAEYIGELKMKMRGLL